jgi:hypothetical protein
MVRLKRILSRMPTEKEIEPEDLIGKIILTDK